MKWLVALACSLPSCLSMIAIALPEGMDRIALGHGADAMTLLNEKMHFGSHQRLKYRVLYIGQCTELDHKTGIHYGPACTKKLGTELNFESLLCLSLFFLTL